MGSQEPFHPTTRELVLRALSLRPGATPTQLVRMTGSSAGSIDHALRTLVKRGDIAERRDGGPQYWLAKSAEGPAFALHGAALRFFNAVHEMGGGTLHEVAQRAGISVPEASRLGKALTERRLLYAVRMGRELCFLAGAPAQD